jgi:hypothetical protein
VDAARFAVVGKAKGPGQAIVKSADLPSSPFLIPVK